MNTLSIAVFIMNLHFMNLALETKREKNVYWLFIIKKEKNIFGRKKSHRLLCPLPFVFVFVFVFLLLSSSSLPTHYLVIYQYKNLWIPFEAVSKIDWTSHKKTTKTSPLSVVIQLKSFSSKLSETRVSNYEKGTVVVRLTFFPQGGQTGIYKYISPHRPYLTVVATLPPAFVVGARRTMWC